MTRTSSQPQQVDPDELVSYLNESSIRIAVFGEFSAGKTTVLNALIKEEILSVAVEPTTAVPTRVRYGREFNIFVERTDGGQPALFEDDPPFWTRFVGRRDTLNTLRKQQDAIRDFLRTWTKEGNQADEVERVVIELPLDWLKGGLELVDTPGVNNEFARHQGFTEQEAGAADIAVLLMDARQGGGKRTEFEFMNEVQKQVERCIVAPNKMDLLPAGEREEFLDYVSEKALPNHWNGAVTPPVMGISALAALHPGEHDEPGLVSAFDDLREKLEQLAKEERGKLLLSRKGNLEKQLFAQAKELEAEEHYGRAHRLYFDLLDVLEAAGLDPAPAEEGIDRCEDHLSAQVDALDDLNERYNEAMALAEEDPDAALEELKAIRDQKEDLRLKDGDLHASIEQLQERIQERDNARSRIRAMKATVENHRQSENWIDATEEAKKIPPLVETAELREEKETDLRNFVDQQVKDRDEWAKARWQEIKDRVDTYVKEKRFLDAETLLDELETTAPYTPFEEKTEALATEIREKAKLETKYRQAAREAVGAAEILYDARVDPDAGEGVEIYIDEAASLHQKVYGILDLPNRPPINTSDLVLTIGQKLGLAQQLQAVAKHAPARKRAEALVEALKERKVEIALATEDQDGLDLVEEYPDHPDSDSALIGLLDEWTPFWASPSRIRQTRSAIENHRDQLPEERTEKRIRELTRQLEVFEWSKEDTPFAVGLVLMSTVPFGMWFYTLIEGGDGASIPFSIGLLIIIGGLMVQYLQPSRDVEQGADKNRQSDETPESSTQSPESQTSGHDDHPAGTWRCPDCGHEKRKEQGYEKVWCQCMTPMEFVGEQESSSPDSSTVTDPQTPPARQTPSDQQTPPASGYPAGRWQCPDCGSSKHKEEGFKEVPCQECGTYMRFVAEMTEIERIYDE